MTAEHPLPPHEHLLEILLEEHFRRRPAAPATDGSANRSRGWLLVAGVVLGLGAVLGAALLPRAGDTPQPVSPQDPEPPRVRPHTPGEYVDLLEQVVGVRLRVMATLALDGGGSVDLPDLDAVADLPAESLAAFVASVPKVLEPGDRKPSTMPLRLELVLREGREWHLGLDLGAAPTLHPDPLPAQPLASGPLVDTLRTLEADARRNGRLAYGIVHDLAELELVPASRTALVCPPLTRGKTGALMWYPQLTWLELVPAPTRGEVLPRAAIAEFAVIPSLRGLQHLRLPGIDLTDRDAADLRRLPALRSLHVDGDLHQLGADGHRALVDGLDALTLADVPAATAAAIVRAAVARGRLRRLTLAGAVLPAADFVALLGLPSLRELGLGGDAWTDDHLAALAASRPPLERLVLEHTAATAAGLRRLAALRELRELDLRMHDPGRLDPDLSELLPRCRIRQPGEAGDPQPGGRVPLR